VCPKACFWGAGQELTSIDGSNSNRCLKITGTGVETISLSGLTFQNGYTTESTGGGGINILDTRIMMDNCIVSKCWLKCGGSSYGGGISLSGAVTSFPSKIQNTLVSGNLSQATTSGAWALGGGLSVRQDNCVIQSCVFSGNIAQDASSTGDREFGDGAESYGYGISFHSCQFTSGQEFYTTTPGTHGSYNVFCGGVNGPLAGVGNQYSCEFYGNDGACCVEGQCMDLPLLDCVQLMGYYSGVATSCAITPCEQTDDPFGACCISGTCGEMSSVNCTMIGGTWSGDFVLCSQVICEPPPAQSACCVGSLCVMLQETVCSEVGGIWNQKLTNCKTAICNPWFGACCVSGSCLESTLDECFVANGSYGGDLSLCENTSCASDCLGDINSDGTVNTSDLLTVISVWGSCP